VGRAKSVELVVDLNDGGLLAKTTEIEFRQSNSGNMCWMAEFEWPIEVTRELEAAAARAGKMLPLKNLPLSAEERTFLAEGFPKQPAPEYERLLELPFGPKAEGFPKQPAPEYERLLELAFGPKCDELGRTKVWHQSISLVLAFDTCEKTRDGRF